MNQAVHRRVRLSRSLLRLLLNRLLWLLILLLRRLLILLLLLRLLIRLLLRLLVLLRLRMRLLGSRRRRLKLAKRHVVLLLALLFNALFKLWGQREHRLARAIVH